MILQICGVNTYEENEIVGKEKIFDECVSILMC